MKDLRWVQMVGAAAIVLSLLFCPARGQTPGEAEFDARTKKGIEFIYNLEFEKADELFAELSKARPEHPAGHFFTAMVTWWRIMLDMDNKSYDESFIDALDDVVDLCDKLLDKNENDLTALFFKGGAIGFKGRLKAHRSEWLAAANAGRKALPIVQLASELDPGNHDIQLGTGIYNYYADIVPREYPWVKPLIIFIPPGDREKGLQQLTLAAQKGKYASIEAQYFLMQIYYFYEKDYVQALSLAEDLHRRFPANMLFHRYVGRCHVLLSNWEKVQEVFTEVGARVKNRQRGYLASTERETEYYLGLCAMNQGNNEAALKHLYRCDELSRKLDSESASGFMAMANLKVGMLYDLLAKREQAVAQYKKVLGMKEYQDSHRQAEQFLNAPYLR